MPGLQVDNVSIQISDHIGNIGQEYSPHKYSKNQAEPELISNPGMREPGVRLEVANGSRGHGLAEEEVRTPATLRLIINPVSSTLRHSF